MRFAFTEQQLELRSAVRQVLARQCTVGDLRAIADRRRDARGDGDPGRAAERWAVLSELGAPGLLVATGLGGLGLTEVDMVGVLEEAGWAALPEPLAEAAALAAPLLAAAAALVAKGPVAKGPVAGATATGSPVAGATATGSPVAGATATGSPVAGDTVAGRAPGGALALPALAAMAGGGLVATVGGVGVTPAGPVTTTLPVAAIAGGAGAAGIRAAVRTERVAGATRAGLFLLAWDAPGAGWQIHAVHAADARVTPTPSIDGTRDLATVGWTPGAHTMIASGEHAAMLVADVADRAAAATAAQLLGLADRMITLTVAYAKERRQFGRPIGSFQAVKHHLADARVRLELARPAAYRAADSLARALPARSEHASMAKALASDAADLAARVALQVHGAIGYTAECDLHLYMKRAWALSAAWGDAPTHRALALAAALKRLSGPPAAG